MHKVTFKHLDDDTWGVLVPQEVLGNREPKELEGQSLKVTRKDGTWQHVVAARFVGLDDHGYVYKTTLVCPACRKEHTDQNHPALRHWCRGCRDTVYAMERAGAFDELINNPVLKPTK